MPNGLQQLNVDVIEVEDLLVGLILEGKVEGKIDQVGMRLELEQQYVPFGLWLREGYLTPSIPDKVLPNDATMHFQDGPMR